MGEEEKKLLEEFRKFVVEGLGRLKSKDSALIQFLLYEGWIRQYVRKQLKSFGFHVAKGIVVEALERGKCSPECDIIVYKPPPLCSAENKTIAIVDKKQVKAIIEVEKELHRKNIVKLTSKIKKFKKFSPHVFMLTYRLWQEKLDVPANVAKQKIEQKLRNTRFFGHIHTSLKIIYLSTQKKKDVELHLN